jgi:hypothetical protein
MTNPKIQKLFCESFKIEPVSKTFSYLFEGKAQGPFVSAASALRCAQKDYEVFDARLLIENLTYPDITLDLLFAVAKREGMTLSVTTWSDGDITSGVSDGLDYQQLHQNGGSLVEFCALQMLRFRGINVEEK